MPKNQIGCNSNIFYIGILYILLFRFLICMLKVILYIIILNDESLSI